MKITLLKDLENSWRIFALIAVLVLLSVFLNKESLANTSLAQPQQALSLWVIYPSEHLI